MSSNIVHIRPTFGDVLRKYRKKSKLTQVDLAESMNVTRATYNNWETDKNKPSYDQIAALCVLLYIPVHELFGFQNPSTLKEDEVELLRNYRAISDRDRIILTQLIQSMVQHPENTADLKTIQISFDSFHSVAENDYCFAAGQGCRAPDTPRYNEIRLVKYKPENAKADYISMVSGDSMEPTFSDGDKIYIREISYIPDPGSVVVAMYDDNECVIKRVGKDRKLHSDNPKKTFPEKYEQDNVRVMGLVLGKVQEDDFCPPEMLDAVWEAHEDEILDFRRRHNMYD